MYIHYLIRIVASKFIHFIQARSHLFHFQVPDLNEITFSWAIKYLIKIPSASFYATAGLKLMIRVFCNTK